MVAGIVAGREAGQRSRLEMFRRDRVVHHTSRRSPLCFDCRRLPRFGESAVRSRRDDGLGRHVAQDVARFGAAIERRLDRAAAPTYAPPGVERRHRLALAALLRAAVPKPQRTLLWPAQAGNHEVSCLRLGLHRRVRTSLHVGVDLGATPRIDDARAAAHGGANPRNRPENQAFVAGSRVLQRSRRGVFAGGKTPVRDARGHSRTRAEKTPKADRPSLDQTPTGGLVSARDETRNAAGEDFGLRGLPPASQPQGRQAAASEVVVRRMASAWFAHRNPRTVPFAVRHRNQFSPNAAGSHLHLHAQSSPAAVFSGRGVDLAEHLGMDSSDSPCRRIRRSPDSPLGTVAIQTHARLDRPRNRRPISRWLNTLRHPSAINQTSNYCNTLSILNERVSRTK